MEGLQSLSCPTLQIEAETCAADSGVEFGSAGGCRVRAVVVVYQEKRIS